MNALRNPWFTGLLAIVAVVVVWYQLFPPHPNIAPQTETTANSQTSSTTGVNGASREPVSTLNLPAKPAAPELVIDRDYVQAHLAAWIGSPARDPFQLLFPSVLLETNSPPWARWKLKAIWRQDGSNLAAINQSVYSEGDIIDGYRIDKIEDDQVWLQGPKLRERLTFDKVDINVDPASSQDTNSATPPPEPPKTPEPAQPPAAPNQ